MVSHKFDKEQLQGMTTNERLYETGLIGSFDDALAKNDREEITSILKSVFIDDSSIQLILNGLPPKG